MSQSTITLPKKLDEIAKARAAECGCRTVDQYVQMLIQADSPAPISEVIEKELLKSLAGRGHEATPQFWAEKKRRLRQVMRKAKTA